MCSLLYGSGADLRSGTGKAEDFSVPERITYKMLLRGNVIGCSSVLAKRSVLLEFPMEKDECHEDYLDWLRILKNTGQPAVWMSLC